MKLKITDCLFPLIFLIQLSQAADFVVTSIDKCYSSDPSVFEVEKCSVGIGNTLDMVGVIEKPLKYALVRLENHFLE